MQTRINAVISLLRNRQRSSGGFCFWPGADEGAAFPSLYVMHFLIECRQLGFTVPRDMLSRGEVYLRDFGYRQANGLR